MKIRIDQYNLQKAIDRAEKIIHNKSAVPILDSIKLTAIDGSITLTAFNTRSTIIIDLDGDIIEEGSLLIDKSNFKLIKKLSGELTIKDDCDRVSIEGNRNLKFTQFCPSDYPLIDGDITEPAFTIAESEFKNSLKIKGFAMRDDNRVNMKTCCINNSRIIACDGYRIAKIELNINNKCNGDINIPIESIDELDKILDKKSNAELQFTYETTVRQDKNYMHQLSIKGNGFQYITRLVEGEYLNIDNVIPKDFATTVQLSKSVISKSVDFANDIVAGQNKHIAVFTITDDEFKVSATGLDKHFEETVLSTINRRNTGDEYKIGFDANFLLDIFKAITDEDITIKFGDRNVNPAIVEGTETTNELYLILPVKIAE